MEESKNLKLARQARAENNSEDAKLFYNKAREEDPENGEAKYFYAYYNLYEGKVVEVPDKFQNLCKSVLGSINLIAESSDSKEEKLKSIEEIVNCFVAEPWVINRFMNKKNHETKIGNSYVKVFQPRDIQNCCKVGMTAIKELGDMVEKVFVADAECKRIATIAWKEYVSLAQTWYAYAPKGEAEIYAEKIKKVDPTYEMPKKAGCISSADEKN